MKNAFIIESSNGQVVTIDYCKEDQTCDRVVTFVCDSAHKELIVLGTYYDCGWQSLKTIVSFSETPIEIRFGKYNDRYGLYIIFDKPAKMRYDQESISKIWHESWFDDIDDYCLQWVSSQLMMDEHGIADDRRESIVWIGDMTYATGN